MPQFKFVYILSLVGKIYVSQYTIAVKLAKQLYFAIETRGNIIKQAFIKDFIFYFTVFIYNINRR